MTDVNPVAAASTATEAKTVQYDGWDEKGTPIVRAEHKTEAKTTPNSEAAAASDAPKVENPDIAAEPGAAKSSQEKHREAPKGKPDAEERIRQLIAENKALKAERERSREAAPKPPEGKAEAQPTTPPAKPEAPKKPVLKDYDGTQGKTYDDYEAARDQYIEDLATFNRAEAKREALDEFRREQTKNEQLSQLLKKVEEVKSRRPDFDDIKVNEASRVVFSDEAISPAVKRAVARGDEFVDVMYVLAGDEAAFNDFLAKARNPLTQDEAIEYIVEVKRGIREELAKSGRAAKPAATDPDAEKHATPVPVKPRAPKPPSEVGGRGAAPADVQAEAARSGDFRRFEEEENRRRFAPR